MVKTEFNGNWVDRYLRNELNAEDEAAFETALFDSPELQQQLETALAIRQSFELDDRVNKQSVLQHSGRRSHWQPLALAASVVLAAFSTTMYWKVSNEVVGLQSEIKQLNQPRAGLLTVPVDIMRSAGSQTPDVIIQKPAVSSAVVLDIELSSAVDGLDSINAALVDDQGAELLSWESSRTPLGRSQVVFSSSQLPNGRVWLEMSDKQGKVLDRRLLEFLPE